jgi:hypothetical protein
VSNARPPFFLNLGALVVLYNGANADDRLKIVAELRIVRLSISDAVADVDRFDKLERLDRLAKTLGFELGGASG